MTCIVKRNYAVLTVEGPHRPNEDRYIVESNLMFEDEDFGYYAVYDGHGGQFVVDYTSQNLHKNIADSLTKLRKKKQQQKQQQQQHIGESLSDSTSTGDDMELEEVEVVDDGDMTPPTSPSCENKESEEDSYIFSAVKHAFQLTDKNVIGECRKIGDWSGSCVCASLLHNNMIYLANLGDSSAVVFQFHNQNSKVISRSVTISTPHKPKLEEQRIDSAGGWVSADGYILGVLSCSRSLGDRELKYFVDFEKSDLLAGFKAGLAQKQKLAAMQMKRPLRGKVLPRQKTRKIPGAEMKCLVSPKPDVQSYPIGESDALLVIASDGLWDYISPKRSVELVNEAYSKNHSLEDVCRALVTAAQRARSTDDITVLVVSLEKKADQSRN